MPKIKIKSAGSSDNTRKRKLLEILFSHDVETYRVFPANDGFTVVTADEENGDKIFTNEVKSKLVDEGFNPIMPHELKIKKSVIVTRVDDAVYERGENDIIREFKDKNIWVGDDLDSIYKFPNSNTIKLTFTKTQTAKKCTDTGIKGFGISIPHFDIRQETYIPILCCLKCYELEDHTTRECPKGHNYKMCSECSSSEHLWHECKAKEKKCINCKENHSTLAMKCPKRKVILKEKRKQEIEKQKMTYSGVTQSQSVISTQPMPQQYQVPQITKEEILKINICVSHAHYANIANPGTYSDELNKVLTANNLPNIIIPYSVNPNSNQSQQQRHIPPQAQAVPVTQPRSRGAPIKTQSARNENDAEKTQQATGKDILETDEIGLYIYTTKEQGWPKLDFTVNKLVHNLRNNKYKFIYDDYSLDDEKLFNLMLTNKIRYKDDCWKQIERDEFRKLRSGLNKDRSPIASRDPRVHKPSYD